MTATHMHDQHTHCHHKSLSWTAVITGALVGVGLSFLLNLFSVSIGLSAFTTSSEGLSTLAIGGFIGLLIVAIVSMFLTGWVAGYLGQPYCRDKNMGVLYGFTAWCLALILAALLASTFGHFVTSYAAAMSNPPVEKVNMTTQDNAPMVSENKKETGSEVTVNTEKAANAIGATAFVTFILFFVGALSSCFGGYSGCESRRCCETNGCK